MKWVSQTFIKGKRIDDIEKSINEIMTELGEEEEQKHQKWFFFKPKI